MIEAEDAVNEYGVPLLGKPLLEFLPAVELSTGRSADLISAMMPSAMPICALRPSGRSALARKQSDFTTERLSLQGHHASPHREEPPQGGVSNGETRPLAAPQDEENCLGH
jgi:hypothetical protein